MFAAGWPRDEKRTSDRRVSTRVRGEHGQGGVDVEPDTGQPVVRVRVAAQRVHLVAAQQPSGRGRRERAEVRQGPIQQSAGYARRPAVLRRVHVHHQEHPRRE